MEREVIERTSRKAIIIAAVIIVMMALVGIVVFTRVKSEQVIPEAVKKQLSFGVFLPSNLDTQKIDKSTIKYTADKQLLTYEIISSDGNKLVVSEQPSPESFIDVPQSYDKLISSLQQYSAFDTKNGRVYLTRPTALNGSQNAVMNDSGVLLFIRPDKDMTDDAWKSFFNDLEIVR